MTEHDDNVVPFPRGQFEKARNEHESALDVLPVRVDRGTKLRCQHERSTVNEADRTVTCRDCDAVLDPIHVLARLAGNREYLVNHGRMLRREATYLQTRVDDLERQEKNLKARLRRAEHPALKEARLALGEAEKVLWDVQAKIAFDPTLRDRTTAAWSRIRRAAEALKPSKVSAS